MTKISRQWVPLEGPRDRSLLRAQARWILTVALVTVVSALVLSWALHDPVYRSDVHVIVNPALTPSGAALSTNMETERQVAISGTVLSAAAKQAGVPPDQLRAGLSVTVPPETTVLVFEYQDRTAATAQRRAQALADAYITYRGTQAALLTPATVPPSPTRPAYVANGAAALVLGLLLGLGTAMLRDRRDDSVRGPQDLARQADVPVLVTVPASPAADGARGFVVLEQPWSSAAEAYRQLRTKLRRMTGDRQGAASITLVVGAAEDDGASEVAANIAAELAVAGSRVLLVEADLRRDGLVEAVTLDPTDQLMRLAAGDGDHLPPGQLLGERAIDRLLGQIPHDVQHVVVHASPVLRVAATSTVAERADLVVIAALMGRTASRDVRAAVAELRGGGATLAGCVLMLHRTEREPLRERSVGTDAPTADRIPAPHGRGAHRSPGQPDADLVSASDI
jgi:succinoglycan biosynthesis transport protein ExoP